jgi:spermidine synthase
MSNLLNKNWFTESCDAWGTAFSFHITDKLYEQQSPYQKVCIYQTTQFGKLMTIDGCIMLTEKDNFLYHEMLTHPALFTHPNPQHVVIIGGGDCGTLQQVLRHHSVKTVIQIDIDECVTRAAEQFFPQLCVNNHDPRATLLFADGIKWIAEADSHSVDIIIVDSTDPIGPGEALFKEAFYQHCFRCLKQTGLLVQQSESPFCHEKIIKKMQQYMQTVGFEQTQLVNFPQPCYPMGWWSAMMAGKLLALNEFRETDVNSKAFPTRYYNAAIHRGALAQPNFVLDYLG